MAVRKTFKVIRDPLWNNIEVDAEALEVLDTEPFQRLRYIRQLGHGFLVYPGATHTRFEHALGSYHLARRAMGILGDRGELREIPQDELLVVRLAALLHDIGHYPFSHALEEAGLPSHEDLAQKHFQHPQLQEALTRTGIAELAARLSQLIAGRSDSPLSGLISGSLDLDKIEYLTRDARMCGVPYGTVDVDRLLNSLTVITRGDGSRLVGVREKGVSALESLLFARYEMYRNVYWHHAVRSATAMFKRLVRSAISRGAVTADWIAQTTDEALMVMLRNLADAPIAQRLHRRELYKRVLEVRGRQIPEGAGDWVADHPDLTERVEDQLAEELDVGPGDVLLDFPAKAKMLEVDLPLLTRDGKVERMGVGQEGAGRLGIHGVAENLHASARHLRVFAAEPREIDRDGLLQLIAKTKAEIEEDLAAGRLLVK
jgi:HD superfamily phosphohydrolase